MEIPSFPVIEVYQYWVY